MLGFFSRLANRWLRGADHVAPGIEENPPVAAEEPATMAARDPGHETEPLDGVTGSEFVDDAIREQE